MRKIYFSFMLALLTGMQLFGQAGVLDATFGTAGLVNTSFGTSFGDEINDIAIQSDGKIVAVGLTYDPNTNLDKIALARYNTNGLLDATFGTSGLVTTTVLANFDCSAVAVDIQTDGKIIVGGQANDSATLTPQNGYFVIMRYNANGTLDNTFGLNGIKRVQSASTYSTEVTATDMLLQPDGSIVLSGAAYYTASSEFVFIRVNSSGVLDAGFGSSGVAVISSTIGVALPNAVALQTDGKIAYSGYIDNSTTNSPFVGRLNSNGSIDTGFGNWGHAMPTFTGSAGFLGITLDNSGNIIACGFGNDGALIQRFLPNGSVDVGFGNNSFLVTPIGTQQDATLYDVTVQNDTKIIAGGFADGAFALMRTSAQGSIDAGFGNNGIVQTTYTNGVAAEAHAIKIQGDGKIVLGGTNITANVNAISMFALARYTNDVTTSLRKQTMSNGFSFYPNPATDHLTFQTDETDNNLSVEIYSLSGQLMIKENISAMQSQLSVKNLPDGLYTVTINTKTKALHQKLIVAH